MYFSNSSTYSSIVPACFKESSNSNGFCIMEGWNLRITATLNPSHEGLGLHLSHHWNQLKAFPSKANNVACILSSPATPLKAKYLSNLHVQPNASSPAKTGISSFRHCFRLRSNSTSHSPPASLASHPLIAMEYLNWMRWQQEGLLPSWYALRSTPDASASLPSLDSNRRCFWPSFSSPPYAEQRKAFSGTRLVL
ncbi:hypothetical protein Lalb_Chr06g0162021 [Lupinus albus]|uniref:Uncharacterized protein n=1 Tax=Lupinus albus TaxID=3870 RepID=A0A6A4QDS6_LUPAL|nr:hypothetical protein Lalb_Chr06g0162021 [Lupinus albus]